MIPLFSIIIPTFNRSERLKECLQSLLNLDYSRARFEVIVVDDGSTCPLDEIVAPFQTALTLRLIAQANSGPASARNTGAANAKGVFLVFTDDDCKVLPNYLTVLEARFLTTPEGLIGGQTLNALPHNLFSTASQILIDYLYQYYNREPNQASFFASNNFAMPSDRFRAFGGFSTRFPLAAGEDREFCDRWLYQGYPLIYAAEAQISHAHTLTLVKFWRQHFNYGRGAYCFHQIRAQRMHNSIQVEPFRFYFNLLAYPFLKPSSQASILLSGLLFISQVANVLGFFLEKWQQGVMNERVLRTGD
jgi:glycosyltransferase involved in cell wall biosynthesis